MTVQFAGHGRAEDDHGILFGCTVAKALVFLDQAALVQVRVVTGTHQWAYLACNPQHLRAAIAAYDISDPMPTRYNPVTRQLFIGSSDAIRRAEAGDSA